ncbi:hypothetical protein [Deinococcus sp. PESE-13]
MTCDICDGPLSPETDLCPICQGEAEQFEWLSQLDTSTDLPTLRRVWKKLHGEDKPRRMDAASALRAAARPACSMMDDDRLSLWVIRAGQVVSTQLHDLSPRRPLQLSLPLQPGDTVLSFHDHSCAGDCDHRGADFFRGFVIE